jgi:carbon-monoxide dehydrogenase medium subunit
VDGVSIPEVAGTARFGFFKFCRKVGEFAEAMAAVMVDPDRGGCRIVLGATETAPVVLADPTELIGGRTDGALDERLDEGGLHRRLQAQIGADRYTCQVQAAVLKRALREAAGP